MTAYNFRCLCIILLDLEKHCAPLANFRWLCTSPGDYRQSYMFIYKSIAVSVRLKTMK